MRSAWTGDPDLIRVVTPVLRAPGPAAVAVITGERESITTTGTDRDSTFEIGSVSKALTGMLYRDVVDRGVVSAGTVLRDLLPLEGRGEVGDVTLSSLATHRSGLPRLPPGMHVLRRSLDLWLRGKNPYGDSLSELLAQTRDVRLRPPRPRYSNLGFELLGHAVAHAAGTDYRTLLGDVLGPGFSAPVRQEDLGDLDLRGSDRFGRSVEAWVGEAVSPAGGVRASISTMCRLVRSTLKGTARGVSALEPVAPFAPRVGIGAGWITLEHRGRRITWHNGSTGGFGSWIGLDRAAGVGVVVLTATHRSVDRQGFHLLREFTPPGT